jgi:hypothetical protein
VKKNEGSGLVIFYDKHSLQPVKQIGIANSSAIVILWYLCFCHFGSFFQHLQASEDQPASGELQRR